MKLCFAIASIRLDIWVGIAFLLCCIGCSEQGAQNVASAERFFSLKNYFTQEAHRLQTAAQQLNKTATLNGETESKQLSDVDWKRELHLFIQSDINKSSWLDKYVIDSVQENNFLKVIYQHQDPKLRTKNIELTFEPTQDKPQSIKIVNETSNPLYQTHEELYYQANQGFTINTTQHVTFLPSDSLHIMGSFF